MNVTDGLDWSRGSLNNSTYRAMCRLAAHILDQHAGEGASVLKETAYLIEQAGDTPDPAKLAQQFGDAFAFIARQRAGETLGATEFLRGNGEKWADPEPELIQETGQAFADWTLERWESISLARASEPVDVLPVVFPPESLVCGGFTKKRHFIRQIGPALYELARASQFVVPNPAKCWGVAQRDGWLSLKCSENFPERHFIIVEFDCTRIDPAGKLPLARLLDLQAALHAHLTTEYAPLVMLVFSGHRSLHGWYPCVGVDEERVLALLRYACRLGADHCLSAASFFTRMPCGTHENGNRQTVHFFNPGNGML